MSKAVARTATQLILLALVLVAITPGAFAQNSTFFTPGNLVVAVEGCGVHGGTCTNIPNGTGTGVGNSSNTGYGDNQAAPLTLFQYSPNGTSSVSFVNSLILPQSASGANSPVSGEYGSSSEATLNLSGSGNYLTIMGYGITASTFNASPTTYGPADAGALAQSNSLTGQSTPAIPRVVSLIDPNGNVNSSTAIFNIFNTNNPRSAYTASGSTAYVSGQGASNDATQGVFYVPIGATTTSPTAITGLDALSSTGTAISQDTRSLQIYNNTLYVSVDTKGGTGSARSFIGTLGTPPATTLFNSAAGPTQLTGFGTSKTGKITIGTGANGNGNNLNSGAKINLSPVNYFFASSTVLYVADSGNPKNDSNGDTNSSGSTNIGDGGLQKWVLVSGTWTLEYTLYNGLNLVNNGGTNGNSGLYGLAGKVNGTTVSLYATNYTLNDLDPTYLYGITDTLSFTTASQAVGETFTILDTAPQDSNFKGVSFAPSIPAGSVEVTTSPSGLTFTSSGTGCAPGTYTSPITLAWTAGSSCTLAVSTPVSGGTGVQYAFSQWEDGTTSTSHVVTAPTTTATYKATYATDYLLTTSAGTGGTVSSGGYYASGTTATVTATPNSGYSFVNFTGTTTSTSNPLSLVMTAPQTITANFAQQASQTINFTSPPPPSAAYGSSFTVAATGGGSGNPVTFTGSGACTNSGATFTMTSPSGTCSVIANQAGNSGYLAAPTVTQTTSATAASTTLSVSSVSPSSEDYGLNAPVTITAVLSWMGTGSAPTSTDLTISGNGPNSYGATTCGAASGDAITCTANYTPTTLDNAGSYTEKATFTGDANYNGSSSAATNNFTINSATTSTSVTSSPSASAFGQSVTFTATIAGENGAVKGRSGKNGVKKQVVTGSITWSAITGCASSTISNGTATCTTTTLPVGTDSVTATYAGDSNHSGSAGTDNQVVSTAATTTAVTSVSPSSEDYGSTAPVAITATLSWTGSGAAPTGAVTITGGGSGSYGATTCSAASGTTITCSATYTPTGTELPGSYTESASFAGDGNYAASSSSATNNFTINTATATTVVSSSGTPSIFGQSVTFTATVSGENGAVKGRTGSNGVKKQVVSGSVTWSGNTGCAASTINNGVATCTTTTLPVGTDSITATYSGDSNHSGSTGTFSQTVNTSVTTIAVTSVAPSSEDYGADAPVTITAALSWTGSGSAPTGAVTIVSSGPSGIGGTTCSAASGNTITCTATYTPTSADVAGAYTESASFAGDGNYAASSSTQSNNFNINIATSSTSVMSSLSPSAFGQSVTFTATVAGENGLVKGRAGKNGVKRQDVTGSVTWSSNTGCAASTITSGVATCTTTTLPVGTDAVMATYAGDSNHSGSNGSVSQVVGQATVSVVWATPSPITYGTALSGTQLNAAVNPSIPGMFVYNPTSGTVLNAGSQTLSVTFTPNDSADYSSATGSVTLVVNKAATSVVWSTPAAITYGTALSATQLNATATPVSTGTFAYTPSSGTILNAGSQPLSVTFTPSGANYAASTGSVTLVVNQATQSITFTTKAPASATYNSHFTVAATSTSTLPVTFTAVGSCTVSGATYTMTSGSGTCSVNANQSGSSNYKAATQVSESVVAAPTNQTITVTIPAPASAVYDSSFTVVATATDGYPVSFGSSGGCTNSAGTYTMASSGTTACTITMNQSGNNNYNAAPQVTETTTPKTGTTPTTTFTGAPTSAAYNASFTVTASTNAGVSATITVAPAATCSISGTTVTITAATGTCTMTASWPSTSVYSAATATQTTTAIKATPVITWPAPAAIVYGTPLSSTQLDASTPIAGKFAYSPLAGKIEPAGQQTLSVTFTPTLGTDYNKVTTTVPLTVTPESTTTAITNTSPNPSTVGTFVTINFAVTQSISTTTAPTGKVTVTASTGETCSANLSHGASDCRIKFLTSGSRTLTAAYPGDNNNQASTSPAFSQSVN